MCFCGSQPAHETGKERAGEPEEDGRGVAQWAEHAATHPDSASDWRRLLADELHVTAFQFTVLSLCTPRASGSDRKCSMRPSFLEEDT